MIARLSLVAMLLISSSVFSMENYTAIPMHELSTTGKANCISSLQHWKEFARRNASLEGYEVLPKAVAEYQQEYEIKTNLPISSEAITIWERCQESPQFAQEVLRIHTYLHSAEDIRDNAELAKLKDEFIKKAYVQLDQINKDIIRTQQNTIEMRRCGIFLCSIAVVLFVGFILELVLIPRPSRY